MGIYIVINHCTLVDSDSAGFRMAIFNDLGHSVFVGNMRNSVLYPGFLFSCFLDPTR